jgi:hypothetical protein
MLDASSSTVTRQALNAISPASGVDRALARMSFLDPSRLLTYVALVAAGAAALILVGIIWSLVQPAPLPVIGAMSVGQLLGTLSLLFFVYAIFADLRPALAQVREQAFSDGAAGGPEAAVKTAAPSEPPAKDDPRYPLLK